MSRIGRADAQAGPRSAYSARRLRDGASPPASSSGINARTRPRGLWAVRLIRIYAPVADSGRALRPDLAMTLRRCTGPLLPAVVACLLLACSWGFGSTGLGATAHQPIAPSESDTFDSGSIAYEPSRGPENAPLSVPAPVPSPDVVDAGQRLNLSVYPSGGYQPYNITWLGLPSGCTSQNKTKFHCFPGTPSGLPAISEVSVRVIDVEGNNVTSSGTSVTVNPDPTVAIAISPSSAGVPPFFVNFTAVPTGGTPPFQYNWTFGDGGNGTGTTVEHEYTATGTFSVSVWGNDSFGEGAVGHAKVRSVALPSIFLSIAPLATVLQGAEVTFSATPDGGLGPYSYQWMGLPSFCAAPTLPNQSTISCTDSIAGVYTVRVVATDALQHSAVGTVTLTVAAPASFWEYVALGFLALAIILSVVVAVQFSRYRRGRRPPPPLQPVDQPPPP